ASGTLGGGSLPIDPEDLQHSLAGQQGVSEVAAAPGRELRIMTTPLRSGDRVLGALQVGESLHPLEVALASLQNRLGRVGAVSLAMAALLGWAIAYAGLRPLRSMTDQMERIHTTANFGQRIYGAPHRDEIGDLQTSFNRLLGRVEETLHNLRDFVAATSHELRNPLAVIRANLDLIERTRDPELAAECLQEARESALHMTRLVGDLLLLAQVEANQVVELRPLPLHEVVREAARQAGKLHPDRTFDTQEVEEVQVRGDRERLKQAVMNLLDNAARYTPPGGCVWAGLTQEGQWARLTVRDEGPGIPAEHLPHIFDRFYRVALHPGRRRDNHGIGLGLAIVRHIIEAHGGRATAASLPAGGAEFTLTLPALAAPATPLSRRLLPNRVPARRG
ncbi:MAG: HAMP domain-containing sensor histidine kinase, partial [Chloroflexi bacterium]|nr:HAMP domain-containing sensor histidine kinase [Chloroflexota bacterium]